MSATKERERRPKGQHYWTELDAGAVRHLHDGPVSAWKLGNLRVVSVLNHKDLPDLPGAGPQWHLFVSRVGGKRPSWTDIRSVLRAFGMVGADEDFHDDSPATRHMWQAVSVAAAREVAR